jgi:Protein of unknown function (DUF3096).
MAELVISAQLLWGLVSIVFGIIVLLAPKILNYLIALYFILTGVIMILPSFGIL